MRPDCRKWRESLGAYAIGQLPAEERAGLEAHLDGCPDCREELEALSSVARLMPLADAEHLDPAPRPPAGLADRIVAEIADERRAARRRRLRIGLSASAATAAVAAAALAIFVLPGGDDGAAARHVSFESLPAKLKLGATLERRAFGTEVHVYAKGVRPGTLCRVFLIARDGSRRSAGSFRYNREDGYPILSSALELSRTGAIEVQLGKRAYVAPLRASSNERA